MLEVFPCGDNPYHHVTETPSTDQPRDTPNDTSSDNNNKMSYSVPLAVHMTGQKASITTRMMHNYEVGRREENGVVFSHNTIEVDEEMKVYSIQWYNI